MKKTSPPLFLFGILGIIIILLVPLTTLSPSQTPSPAYAIEKDFCLEATSPDGDTIEDCSDKPKFCRSLYAFYENQGFTITQKCRAQVTGE
jgi:hypothetical protein